MKASDKLALSRFLIVLVLAAACSASARAQSFSQTHAKVAILAESNSLEPGHTAWIGLFFDLEQGWHIYWVNPGDSGESPRVAWTLPKGFRAGGIRWPSPIRLGTGTVIDYGYEGRVLLPVPLQVPAGYKAGAPAMLAADVKYLICREVCIPAKAHAALAISPAGPAPADAAAARDLFRGARDHWPKPMPATWKAQVADDGKNFVLSVQTGSQEAKASFFPLEEDQVDNAAPQTLKPTDHGVQITLKKSDQLLKPIPTLKGVLVFGPPGSDRAYAIAAPVAARR
jgi:DsbC/DsbD-like thiol-disulfide interchange protein